MFGKISKENFRYLLVNSKGRIAFIFDILDEIEALDILSYIYYNNVNFETLKADMSDIELEVLSGYIVRFLELGILEIKSDETYELSKTAKKFLELTVQLIFESYVDNRVADEKMNKIFVKQVGKKELDKFRKDRQENKAKGLQLSLRYISGN